MAAENSRLGFTMIEMLVVFTIIGLLAALLFPIFIRARERGNRTVCESNLRQIGVALHMYQTDHDGALPSMFGDASALPKDEQTRFDPLLPYEHSSKIYHCPDLTPSQAKFQMDYNYRLSDLYEDVSKQGMKVLPESVLVYDMNHSQRSGGVYIALRASGDAAQIPRERAAHWEYDGKEWRDVPHGDGMGHPTELVFPGEPWPPEFGK